MPTATPPPRSPQHALTRRMVRLAEWWPWDDKAEVAVRVLLADIRHHIADLIEQWLSTVYSTCERGMDRVDALWEGYGDDPMPPVLGRLIDEAGDLQNLRRNGLPLIKELTEAQVDHLTVSLGRLFAATMRTVGGFDAYAELVELHTRYAVVDHTDAQRRAAALIVGAIAAGNANVGDEYAGFALARGIEPNILLGLWWRLISELAGPSTTDVSLTAWLREDGLLLGLETVPGHDITEDGELTSHLAADMISALRAGDTGRVDDAGRRMAYLPLPHYLTLTRQVAHTAGVLVGQVRAQKAAATSR